MDSSPVNPYLLFQTADEFRPADKVAYSLKHPSEQQNMRGLRKLSQIVESHCLLRSLEELRRIAGVPFAPCTRAAFNSQFTGSSHNSPEVSPAPIFTEKHSITVLEDAGDSENSPWDNLCTGTSIWRWPVEVLYQRYHLLLAIDFGFSTFSVSEKGKVLIDHVPHTIEVLFEVIEKTLQTREQEAFIIKRWASTHLEEDECERIMQQVWRPSIDVSMVLINVPKMVAGAFGSVIPNMLSSESMGMTNVNTDQPSLLPPDVTSFPAFDYGVPNDSTSNPLLVPLMPRCDALKLLQDKTFLPRLGDTLRAYEEACRSRLVDDWPDRTLFSSMEYLVRLIPERSPECTSLVLFTNHDKGGSLDSVSLLESSVRRKNIILSLLFLSEATSIYNSHTTPLSQFLSTVGGFGVHFDYWLSLANPRLNVDWCRRFGGPRCLAQQLFVQLENKFPVCLMRISQNMPTTNVDRSGDPYVLYNSDNILGDFTLRHVKDVVPILRCVAEARLNQGWSVVMNCDPNIPHVAQLHARYHHNLRRGKLTIVYEMEISHPVVYRRVLVYGTKVIVDHFLRAKGEERSVTSNSAEAKTGWLTYLVIVRSQLHSWMIAEQVALQFLLATESLRKPYPVKELQSLSCHEGISTSWSSHCSIRSVGFFFRWKGELQYFLDPFRRMQRANISSVAGMATDVLRSAMQERYRLFADEEGEIFIYHDEKYPRHIVQLFLPIDVSNDGHDIPLALGFECRFSFFLASVADEIDIIEKAIADVEKRVSTPVKLGAFGNKNIKLVVEASTGEANGRALHLTLSTLSPQRLELVSTYSEPLQGIRKTTLRGVTNRKIMSFHSSVNIPTVKRIRNVQQLTFRCFLTPYVVSPWLLSDALVFHWVIGALGMWRTFPESSFNFFVARRLRDGFRLLYCLPHRKAILYATQLCDGEQIVEIFDVIEAPIRGGDADLTAQVVIFRYMRPFKVGISSYYRYALTSDISEDIQIATVLHTFTVLSSSLYTTAENLMFPKETRRGFVRLTPKLELLLPFLSTRHVHSITLYSLPSLGEKGNYELQEAVIRFLSSLGDRSGTVSADAVHESLQQKMYDIEKKIGLESNDLQKNQFFFSLLAPREGNCLTFLLMPRICKEMFQTKTNEVTIQIISLDAAALYRGLMRLCLRSGEEELDEKFLPDSLDTSLFEAITKLLTCFSSLFQAWRLLEEQRDGMERHASEEAEVAKDVVRIFSNFQDYQKEVDISHLLYIQESQIKNSEHSISLHETLRSLIMSIVRSMFLRPLWTHPAVFHQVNEKVHDSGEEIPVKLAADSTSVASSVSSLEHHDQTTLPFLVKVALIFISEDGEEKDCIWILAPKYSKNNISEIFASLWSPTTLDLLQRGSQRRLIMRLFVKTAPKQFVDLSCNRYNPSIEVIRRILGEMLRERKECPTKETETLSLFFTAESSILELGALYKQALPFEELPLTVQSFFNVLVSDLTRNVAQHCLTDCLNSAPFDALRSLVMNVTSDRTETSSPTYADDSNEVEDIADLRVLTHDSSSVLFNAPKIHGLKELLAFAVSPALLSVPCFEADSFAVEFTQQSTCSYAVDPTQALHDVLTRRLADDLVCVVQATSSCFLFVPNRHYFASRWLMIQVNIEEYGSTQQVRLLFNEHEYGSTVCMQLSRHLRRLIEAKVREVSQLHLLKQLRDTQNANDELIPGHWGDQFPSALPGASKTKKDFTAPLSAAFYCLGTTVLKIPVYYKLQHQCKKILSRISSNSSRLELINIYNREQCFVVADEVQRDTFHYIRIVFVKDTAHPPLPTTPSPPLLPTDRCPLIVVQLFSATKNPCVERPLRKLKAFCFFLAVQELQGHLNYVQHKFISAVDLIFLQYRRLDPVSVNLLEVGGGEPLHPEDVQLAFALVVLSLKENKFKYFQVEDERNPLVSNFVEYYGLLKGEGESGGTCSSENGGLRDVSSLLPTTMLRFVKVIEGVTDVLVSCTLRVSGESQLVVERFLTKVPEERYTTGESETTYLKQIDDVVQDSVSQWRFFALSKRFSSLSLPQVLPAVNELMRNGACVRSNESSTLRFKKFSLDRVSPVVFPFLIERIVGVFELFSPVCFECRGENPPMHITGFPWQWIEQLQGDPLAEQVEVYITCGYQVTLDDDDDGSNDEDSLEKNIAKTTHVLRVTHPDLPVTKATVLTQSPLLREHAIELQITTEVRLVAHISLIGGVTSALFNLRDSDILLRLLGHVIAEAEQHSDLLHNIMIQRMGIAVPSYITELVLGRICCNDESNMLSGKRFCIHGETYPRRINHVRFPPKTSVADDAFTIIVEGLFNRGLCVNGFLMIDDAIKVLFNECPQYSLKKCQQIIQELLRSGKFKAEHQALTCRVVNSSIIPDDALIGCSFRRHVQTAHILLESQHSRSGIVESLQQCESLWYSASHDNYVALAKSVVLLQRRSKQIFGSRVPDLTLLRRSRWSPSDDILDPALPPRSQLGSEYSPSVNATLHSYVGYIQRLFPTSRIIDLNANSAAVSSDTTLLHRFRCRYGKVVLPDGREIRFVPHLHYALIPIVDILKILEWKEYSNLSNVSLVQGGLFIVEIGFQVAHFALDVFMVNGDSVPTSVSAQAAAWFKQNLKFDSVLYDLTVSRLLHCVQMYATLLPGQLQTSDAIENLVKYYPHPPKDALNIAAVFDGDAMCVRLMRKMVARKQTEGTDGNFVRHVIPEEGEVLLRESTRERYHYCGMLVWASSRFFVLLSTVRDITTCDPSANGDLYKLALRAKRLLLQLFPESTLQQQLELVWEGFRTPITETNNDNNSNSNIDCVPTSHDLQALQTHALKVPLDTLLETFLLLRLDWKTLLSKHYKALSTTYLPDHAMHLIFCERGMNRDTSSQEESIITLTLGPCQFNQQHLMVLEFSDGPCGVIRSAALYRGGNQKDVVTKLSEEETELVEHTLRLLSSLVWEDVGCWHFSRK
ncbi:hypothetical protein LSM04_005954 [Trypanosoma melophagium]|uniref:uncharacterized protein n=1 Tax=Trypanosoma melophagium TaxID=715481 RepID=UPI003519E8D6|nr:hypothetical protein LSM04_005954 [Trypanosoma melophagium]